MDRSIAFTSEVYPDCRDDACNAARDEAREKSPVRARIYDALLYRHWTTWSEGKRLHLFVVPSAGGAARDLLPGANYDVPPRQREGPHPIAFAPDSRTICFTAVTDRVEATSTNGDLFEIDAVTAGATPKRLTTGPGFDGAPAYSPDGRTIMFRSQARPGYESDKWRLMLLDRAIRTADQPDRCLRSQRRRCAMVDRRQVDLLQRRGSGRDAGVRARSRRRAQRRPRCPARSPAGMFDGEFDIAADALVVARSSVSSPAELYQVSRTTGAASSR